MRQRTTKAWPLAVALLLSLTLAFGCAALLVQTPRLEYFGAPSPDDPWSPKIRSWQRRERAEHAGAAAELPPVSEVGAAGSALLPAASGPAREADESEASGTRPVDLQHSARAQSSVDEAAEETLRGKYFSFRANRRREIAREFAAWVQDQAKEHYVPDGPIDHWATLEETLHGGGDDCDGLELLAFHGLRDLGFDDSEVFRSIVYRPSDGQHHMVTLWFEDPNDPWVIDPTGAMTTGMPRMSQLPAWVPLKVFSETAEYTVRRGRTVAATDLVSNP
jgi:hypothetical protein